MEFLKAQAVQIAEQLRGMSLSQRVAIALSTVLVVAAMWGLIQWGGQGEWSDLLHQPLTPEQMQRIHGELTALGTPAKVEGDRILVKGDENERRRLKAALYQSDAMPTDMSRGYAALISDDSVFDSDQKAQWKQLRGLEFELSQILRRFQGIKDASILIDVPRNRGFGGRKTSSRASVRVQMQSGMSLDKHRIAAIANFVVGAVRGLELKNVKITDGLRFYRPPDADSNIPTDLLELQRQTEDHHTQKIYDQLQYIPGVLVNVHAVLRTAAEQMQETKLGPPVVSKETLRTEETTSGGSAAGPGVRPNTRVAITDTSPGQSSLSEESTSVLDNARDQFMKSSQPLVGAVEKLTASVSVPSSFLMRILREQAGGDDNADEPTASAAELEKVATAELPRIRDAVRTLLGAATDEQVVVDWYYDLPPEPSMSQASQPSGYLALAKDYGPQVGLALLALISLFAVLRIAKKAQASLHEPKRGRSGAGGDGEGGDIGGVQAVVGEAQELEGMMLGHEVDETLVRTQQLVDEISTLIRDDPATAANIVEQWLQEEK